VRARKKGGKLFESREKRDEFLTLPRLCILLGQPQAKLLVTFESSQRLASYSPLERIKSASCQP